MRRRPQQHHRRRGPDAELTESNDVERRCANAFLSENALNVWRERL